MDMDSHPNKKNKILPLIAILVGLLVLAIATYAWLSSKKKASDMSFEILQIDALVNMYRANDINYNGVYDLANQNADENPTYYVAETNNNMEYAQPYYEEKYSFDFLYEKWAQSADSILNNFVDYDDDNSTTPVKLKNVVPGKIYGFKYEIFNYIQMNNDITFVFVEDDTLTQEDLAKLATMQVRLAVISSKDGSLDGEQKITFMSDWLPFVTTTTNADGTKTYSYTGLTLNHGNTITLPGITTGLTTGRLDLWLQIRQDPQTDTYLSKSDNEIDLPDYQIIFKISDLSE